MGQGVVFSVGSVVAVLRGFLGFLALDDFDAPLVFDPDDFLVVLTGGVFFARLRGLGASSSSELSSSSTSSGWSES